MTKKFLKFAGIALLGMAVMTSCGKKHHTADDDDDSEGSRGSKVDSDSIKRAEVYAAELAAPAEEYSYEDAAAYTDNVITPAQYADTIEMGMKPSRPLVLDFNAVWCGPCKQFAPSFHQASGEFGYAADFVSVDTDEYPEIASSFGVQSIPTVIIIEPSGAVTRFVGTEDILPYEKFAYILRGKVLYE